MKLYTEEQVRTILDLAKLSVNGDEKYSKDELLESLTPIELPSDEDLQEIVNKILESKNDYDEKIAISAGANLGFLWVIEPIKQQANGK